MSNGKAVENFGWLTKKGVLVLPVTENSRSDQSDYSVFATKNVGGLSYVQFQGEWLQIEGMIHTHPGGDWLLSNGDFATSTQFGVPIFAIGPGRLQVGYGGNNYKLDGSVNDYLAGGDKSVYQVLNIVPRN